MATQNSNAQDNTSRPLITHVLEALNVIATQAQLLLPQNRGRVSAIVDAVELFKLNVDGWFSDEVKPEALDVLQKHLAFTLFVPAGKAQRARQAVDMLVIAKLLPIRNLCPAAAEHVKLGHVDALANMIIDVCGSHVRFPRQKAGRLAKALINWGGIVSAVRDTATGPGNPGSTRRALMHQVRGFGPKAAAHFMRNTGLSSGFNALPIIDVHIHKVLELFNFKHASYTEAEQSFNSLARLVNVPTLTLDAVTWALYANNWDIHGADFDNFSTNTPTKQ